MAPQRTRKVALYLAAQTAGFETDPSSNGSGYTATPVLGEMAPPEDNIADIETKYQTGRNRETASEVGPDGAMLSFDVPWIGNATAAGHTVAPPAVDWADILLQNAFGAGVATNGVNVSSSANSTITLAAATPTTEDLIPVQDANANSARVQWRRAILDSGSTYNIAPNWTDNPTATAVAFGKRIYQSNDTGGGDPIAAHVIFDDAAYTLLGGRLSSLKLRIEAGKLSKLSCQVRFDNLATGTKASLPAAAIAPAITPTKGVLGRFFWGATNLGVKSMEIDFGLSTADDESVQGANGRGDIDVISAFPRITITPAFTTSLETDHRAKTARSVLMQIGAGVLAGGVLNATGFWAEAAQILSLRKQDDQGRARHEVQLRVCDAGIRTGTTAYRYWQLARA